MYVNLSKIMDDIINGNLEGVKSYFNSGNSINSKLDYQGRYSFKGKIKNYTGSILPIQLAIDYNHLDIVKYLYDNGATLPDDIMDRAIKKDNPKLLKVLYEMGGNLEYTSNTGVTLYNRAICDKAYNSIITLYELGLDVKKFGTGALDSAILWVDSDYTKNENINFYIKAIYFLVEHGVNINISGEKYGLHETPIIKATRHIKNINLIKYLIEHGADITIPNKLGERAYQIALQYNKIELVEYYKSLEPTYLHDIDLKIAQFKEFGCPQSMIDFFKQNDITIDTKKGYCKFYSLTDTHTMIYDNHEFISLCMGHENYSSLMILWSKDLKSICSFDCEHEHLFRHCTWEEFESNMPKYIMNAINWDGQHIGDWVGSADVNGNEVKGDIYWEDL